MIGTTDRGYHKLVIEDLSESEAELLARVVMLQAELDVAVRCIIELTPYRELAHQALHELFDLLERHRRLQRQHDRLLDQNRTLRARTMPQAVAVA